MDYATFKKTVFEEMKRTAITTVLKDEAIKVASYDEALMSFDEHMRAQMKTDMKMLREATKDASKHGVSVIIIQRVFETQMTEEFQQFANVFDEETPIGQWLAKRKLSPLPAVNTLQDQQRKKSFVVMSAGFVRFHKPKAKTASAH